MLDDERLNGPHEVHVTFRPERVAIPVASGDVDEAIRVIEAQCQVWGGASTPLVPLSRDGTVVPEYQRILPGSAVDRMMGLDHFALDSGGDLRPSVAAQDGPWWGLQFAPALLEYGRKDSYAILEVVELADDDPWRPIYAACLGRLPQRPTAELLEACYLKPDLRFEDFLRIDRTEVSGTLDDLVSRLANYERLTPRQLSMVHLAYGNAGSRSIRQKPETLPVQGFDRYDAGPNVVVLCTPGSLDDVALLWNIRGAQGDGRVLPIGLPVELASGEVLERLIAHPRIARNGWAHRVAYVTSASLPVGSMIDHLGPILEGQQPPIAVSPLNEMLGFGWPGGWHRSEAALWTHGRAHLTPLATDSHTAVLKRVAVSDLTRVTFDLAVPSRPFPSPADVRITTFNGTFRSGQRTSSGFTPTSRSEVREVEWPSNLLIARAIARSRKLDIEESEPGRACRILLAGMQGLSSVAMIAHAPLLGLLEHMAARQGISWYKERLRAREETADLASTVSSTTEDLPDRAFSEFKKALGNNERAAKYWLLWAERSGLIIKGIPLQCVMCRAKQWLPINAFAPPIICRGCGEPMNTPFGDRPAVNFTYRIAERLRRVYQHDAVGHLLVAHHLDSLLESGKSGRLVGLHPGMEIRAEGAASVVGEADVLLLTREGQFVPIEVKRLAGGLTEGEIVKLDSLATALTSPWSAVAACQYSAYCDRDLGLLVARHDRDGTYKRMVLTYDRLLDPNPIWALGDDPFALTIMSADEIANRERGFVDSLATRSTDVHDSMFEYEMLNRHVTTTSQKDDQ